MKEVSKKFEYHNAILEKNRGKRFLDEEFHKECMLREVSFYSGMHEALSIIDNVANKHTRLEQ